MMLPGFAEPYEAYGPFAYVAGTIITNAINEVGTDRAAVAEYINTTDVEDTIIGPVRFNEYGQNEIPSGDPICCLKMAHGLSGIVQNMLLVSRFPGWSKVRNQYQKEFKVFYKRVVNHFGSQLQP